jgi:type I restriction enzyme M protein
VPIKKSELYSSLWSSCDELRGSMDASQYKDYVLVLLFVKYVSDKYAGQPFAPIRIPPGASFKDMVSLKGKPSIGEDINKKILGPLANANKLSDMPDFADATKLGGGKEMVDRLTNLIAIFENHSLDFSKNRADGDDILGDAYEYLMRHFATESGKSKGQFYTPAEVSRVMAQLLGIRRAKTSNDTTVYDPTCGSGSLLLKVGAEATAKVTLYGQEKDSATSGLAQMNMYLHNNPTALIKQGNTLTNPRFTDASGQLKTFDYVVANPPFSDKRWSTGLDPANDPFERFKHYGVPPARKGDYAYLLHIVRSLKSGGKGACILPHGVLFRGSAEAIIRKNLIRRGYIKAIIGLPANLFYGTGIPACIIVLDKNNATAHQGIFMIDASKGFMKDGPKNRLRARDIHKIVDIFMRQTESPRYSRMVAVAEISNPKNDFNLNLARYIDSTEPEDLQDIDGHLRGGIPDRDIDALERYWQVIPSVRAALFKKADRSRYSQLNVAASDIKAAIFGHSEFTAFNESITRLFAKWKADNTPLLKGLGQGAKPKAFIEMLAEDMLATFKQARLLDPYDLYQLLMDYWAEIMQDDVYIIAADGWAAGARVREIQQVKDKNGKLVWAEPYDYKKGKQRFRFDLVPREILIARYFDKEQDALNALEAELGTIEQEIDEKKEEHGIEGGLLEDVTEMDGDKRKITVKAINVWLKENESNPEFEEERKAMTDYMRLLNQQTDLKGRIKKAQDSLDALVAKQYPRLTEDDIKILVVDDKWLATLAAGVQGELDRVSQTLTGRIRELAERYATPLPQITSEVAALAARVDEHLKKMGAVWK